MYKLLLILIAMVSLQVEAKGQIEINNCESTGRMAEQIMGARLDLIDINVMMGIVKDVGDYMVIDAYSKPAYSGEKNESASN